MNIRRMVQAAASLAAVLSAASLVLSGCNPSRPAMTISTSEPNEPGTQTTPPLPTLLPTTPDQMPTQISTTPASLSLPETSWKDFPIGDFDAVHAPVDRDANQHLIFGNLQVIPLRENLPPDLAAFLGRWEGQEIVPEGNLPSQAVLFIQQIDESAGKAYMWVGEQLQYPYFVKEIRFRVTPGSPPSIEWQGDLTGAPGGKGKTGRFEFKYDPQGDVLRGGLSLPPDERLARSIELKRGGSYFVYRDFLKFLESRQITFHEYADPAMQPYGWGYLVYLPEGYEENNGQDWPLLVFLIGTGERGKNIYLLTRHGPIKEVMSEQALPFIIVMPMLNVSTEFRSFPESYLDGLFEELLDDYRVDRSRIYLTGISMGGEATYRYALHRPDLFAAIVPISAFEARFFPPGKREGFKSSDLPFERLNNIPVWAVHGADDGIIPLSVAQQTVDALTEAGVQVSFTVLEGLGHEAWTGIYADPGLYAWLLEHKKP